MFKQHIGSEHLSCANASRRPGGKLWPDDFIIGRNRAANLFYFDGWNMTTEELGGLGRGGGGGGGGSPLLGARRRAANRVFGWTEARRERAAATPPRRSARGRTGDV